MFNFPFMNNFMPNFNIPNDEDFERELNQDEKEKDYYELLNIKKDATNVEIKKAFRKAALKNHPDRGGDEEKFIKYQKAYEILSDPKKRDIYDKFGKYDENIISDELDMNNIFENIFGNNIFKKNKKKTKSTDIILNLKVTLEDFYNGISKKIKFERNIIEGNMKECEACNGTGNIMVTQKMGPIITSMNRPCEKCNGTGNIISNKKIIKKEKILDIKVPKGLVHGDKLIFRGLGNKMINSDPGNLIIILTEEKKENYIRKNENLLIKKEINLEQAFLIKPINILFLDNKKYNIVFSNKNVIQPGEFYKINNFGMPIKNELEKRGNLIIEFIVKLPNLDYTELKKNITNIFSNENNNIENDNIDLISEQITKDKVLKIFN